MTAFTLFHVALSLVGIITGFVVAFAMLSSRSNPRMVAVFLWTTLLTSVTGFFFPFHSFTPAIGVGILSILLLAPVFYALYSRKLAGSWRWIYVIGSLVALYFNFFVLIVQSFLKIPALHALAPTGQEPPFAATQGLALIGFIVLIVLATKRFHPSAPAAA
ncbi:MAG: hypothetical protein JSS11_00885 [Verrucomicrobia bacterium]|nr:hypothetical protein [Verrucomicrobiota bacterium]